MLTRHDPRVMACLLATGAALAAGCDRSRPDPSLAGKPQRRLTDRPTQADADAPLTQAFNAHRAVFEELKVMMRADAQVSEVSALGAASVPGLATERLADYRARLAAAGIARVARGDPAGSNDDLRFVVGAPPGWPAGARAMFLASESTGLQRVDCIAERLAGPARVRVAREIDLNWYLIGEN